MRVSSDKSLRSRRDLPVCESSRYAGRRSKAGKKEINGPPPQPTLPAVRHAILELIARPPPQRCPHCRKWICNEQRRKLKNVQSSARAASLVGYVLGRFLPSLHRPRGGPAPLFSSISVMTSPLRSLPTKCALDFGGSRRHYRNRGTDHSLRRTGPQCPIARWVRMQPREAAVSDRSMIY